MSTQPRALFIWMDPYAREIAKRSLQGFEIIEREGELKKIAEEKLDPAPKIIICGKPTQSGLTIPEVGHGLGIGYPQAATIYAASDRTGFEVKHLEKNGFRGAFFLPFESPELAKFLDETAEEVGAGSEGSYRPVKLVDLEFDEALDFDTFVRLPLNNKYICYSRSGTKLTTEQKDRLKSREVSTLYIRQKDVSKFHELTALQLSKMGKENAISTTERHERLRQAVRVIFSDLFADSAETDEASGQQMMEDCREIVKSYIMNEPSTVSSLYSKLMEFSIDESGPYAHSANVSTFAVLFSIALQIGDPEELALAGILHDLGFVMMPPDVLNKLVEGHELTQDEMAIYKQHPEFSLSLIKKRHLAVSPKVMDIVLQHHETYTGKGFPKGLAHEKIMPEAQLLAFADALDDLTSNQAFRPRLSPRKAVMMILERENKDVANRSFDPHLLVLLMNLLEAKAADGATKAAA